MGKAKRVSRILIADGNVLFRRGLRALFSADNDLEVLDEASNLTETLAKVRLLSPDVLLMDLGLLQHEGQDAAVSIRQAHPETALLFLTQEDAPDQLELAIAAGARGYMLKNSTAAQLVAGLRQI
ncbi:MAG: response regulator transcription factor, partial [Acidobacteriales bacterium]|nr:response regulator transcription factor [Terriglobales bacterium]